jgi:predicted transposase/invertase (TIGR01784 family)
LRIEKYFRLAPSFFSYEVKLKSNHKDAFIYILFEHKSREEWFICLQLLKYLVRIWEQFLKQNKEAKYLPVIIPLVIYHGKPKWSISENFISLFEETTDLEQYIPDFSYNLYDISHMPDEDIQGTPLLKIFLTTFKYIYSPELRNKLWDILKLFLELSDKTKVSEYLEVLLRYLVNSPGEFNKKELHEQVASLIEEGGDIMQTIAQQLREEGIKIGEEEKAKETAKNLLEMGIDIDKIAKATGLKKEEVEKLASIA